MTTAITHRPSQHADVRLAALTAFLLGTGLIFMAGFAHSAILHNAAHDTRHALSFPCH